MTKDLVENVDDVKSAILNEVFGLNGDATLTEILSAPLKLPKLQSKPIPEKRLASIKKKYETIPREHLWYYPEGSDHNHDDNVEVAAKGLEIRLPKKKIGRPKTLPKDNKTPSILTFFKAFPVIQNPVQGSNSTTKHPTPKPSKDNKGVSKKEAAVNLIGDSDDESGDDPEPAMNAPVDTNSDVFDEIYRSILD